MNRQELDRMLNEMMGDAMGNMMGSAPSSMCTEGNWRKHPQGPLYRAAISGNVSELRTLLTSTTHQGEANTRDGDGATMLHLLAMCASEKLTGEDHAKELIGVIIEHGGDIEAEYTTMFTPEHGDTPLSLAAMHGHVDFARALIYHGAKVYNPNPHRQTIVQRVQSGSICRLNDDTEQIEAFVQYLKEKEERQRQEFMNDDNTKAMMKQADEMRQTGNQLYLQERYEEAIDAYNESNEIFQYHKTYGNIAAAQIKLGRQRFYGGEYGYRRIWKTGVRSAEIAIQMQSDFPKHYLRKAKALMNYRDFPRAKQWLKDGIKACPKTDGNYAEIKTLSDLVAKMDMMGVPNHCTDMGSDSFQELSRKLDNGFVGEHRCPWCTLIVVPTEDSDECPFCSSDPRIEVDEDEIEELIEF